MLYVLILYISGGKYSLKSTLNDKFSWKTFHGNFIYCQSFYRKSAERNCLRNIFVFCFDVWPERVFTRNRLRGNRLRNTFCISFWCLAWNSNPGFSSNKPTHYLLDYFIKTWSNFVKFFFSWWPSYHFEQHIRNISAIMPF